MISWTRVWMPLDTSSHRVSSVGSEGPEARAAPPPRSPSQPSRPAAPISGTSEAAGRTWLAPSPLRLGMSPPTWGSGASTWWDLGHVNGTFQGEPGGVKGFSR